MMMTVQQMVLACTKRKALSTQQKSLSYTWHIVALALGPTGTSVWTPLLLPSFLLSPAKTVRLCWGPLPSLARFKM